MSSNDTSSPVEFVGESGPGAMINQYLPQPGQHVGRRIIRIDDIPESVFLDAAITSGTPWAEYLGLEKERETWGIRSPETLTSNWLGRYTAATDIDAVEP